jgi:hypothetical protein
MMTIIPKQSVRLGVRISPQQKAALQASARRHQATVAAVVKAAIDQFLAQEQEAEAQRSQAEGICPPEGQDRLNAQSDIVTL